MSGILQGNPKNSLNDDLFGWVEWWEVIGDTILEQPTKELPINVGIFAPWGCGKTSFMKILEEFIKEQDKATKTLWFYPWRYDRKEELISAFLFHLTKEVAADRGAGINVKNGAKRLGFKVLKFGARVVVASGERLSGGILPVEQLSEKAWEALFKTHSEFHDIVEGLLEETSQLIREWVGEGRVVVFVDDLDRCLPEHAIQLLEALKLFLHEAPCVFVVGADRTVIEQAIRQHYHQIEGFTEREYLEKIFHLPFNLPSITEENIWKAYGPPLISLGLEDEKLRVPLRAGFGNNPRRFERFLNLYPLLLAMAKKRKIPEDAQHKALLITITVLRIRFHKLFELMMPKPHSLQHFSQRAHASGKESEEDFRGQHMSELYPFYANNTEERQFFRTLGITWNWQDSANKFNPFELGENKIRRVLQLIPPESGNSNVSPNS